VSAAFWSRRARQKWRGEERWTKKIAKLAERLFACGITNNNDAIAISSNNGNTDFDIHDNPNLSGQDFVNISVLKAAFSTTGTLDGRIRNNAITTENGHTADGITVFNAGGGR
jgi:hypothetical protein